MSGSTKKVNISIQPGALQKLAQNGYQMCFAKEVNGHFNVVWQSYDSEKYSVNQKFSWVPVYKIFGTNHFQAGVQVGVTTNKVNIGLGETVNLDSSGLMGQPFSGGPDTSFTLNNSWTATNIGVDQVSTGIDGTTQSTPIYVSESQVIKNSTTTLTPVERIQVWFQQNLETSTMISSSKSLVTTLDLTLVNSAAAEFSDDFTWVTPPAGNNAHRGLASGAAAPVLPPLLQVSLVAVGAVSLADLLMKINSRLTGILSGIEVEGNYENGQIKLAYTQKLMCSTTDSTAIQSLSEADVLSELLLGTATESLVAVGSSFRVLEAKSID